MTLTKCTKCNNSRESGTKLNGGCLDMTDHNFVSREIPSREVSVEGRNMVYRGQEMSLKDAVECIEADCVQQRGILGEFVSEIMRKVREGHRGELVFWGKRNTRGDREYTVVNVPINATDDLEQSAIVVGWHLILWGNWILRFERFYLD